MKNFRNIKLLFARNSEEEFYYFVKKHLGYKPRNPSIYRKALTHKSALVKDNYGRIVCNERLEFLGDTILDSAISDYLFKLYSDRDEGFLTKMRAKIVNRKSLNSIALNLKLDKFLISNNLILKNNNAIGNAFEALIGAMYLDKGYKFTKRFIEDEILQKYVDFNYLEKVETNYKSRLIEYSQKSKKSVVFNTNECTIGNGSDRTLYSSVIFLDETECCEGKGYTKKEAEQNASKIALSLLDNI